MGINRRRSVTGEIHRTVCAIAHFCILYSLNDTFLCTLYILTSKFLYKITFCLPSVKYDVKLHLHFSEDVCWGIYYHDFKFVNGVILAYNQEKNI